MQKRQVSRAVVARRIAAQSPAAPRPSVRHTAPAARATTARDVRAVMGGNTKQRRATRMTATQKDGLGRPSAWARPATLPYSTTVTTHQLRWTATVRDMG